MVCPYRKNTLYTRSIRSGEIIEINELFEDCIKEKCPFYRGPYTNHPSERCLKVELELKGETE